jgi:Flp pilus assembly protein TadG
MRGPPARRSTSVEKGATVKLSRILRRFADDRSATAVVLLAFSAIPIIGVIGLGTDYYAVQGSKTRLDAAADAAAIAAITTAQNYISANAATQSDPTLTNNASAAGQAQARRVFFANAGVTSVRTNVQLTTPAVQRAGQSLTMAVSYTATNPTNFGRLFGVPTFTFSGKAGSSLTMGTYLDFYLMLDMSGSMGLPTSTAGQQQLMNVNPDDRDTYPGGCQFACHFNGSQGYATARKYNITLRVDSVGRAVQNLIQTANQTKTLSNQYRLGIYPFIVNVMQAAALSSNFTSATGVAQQLGDVYMDSGLAIGTSRPMGSGGTHFENVFPGIYNYMQPFGTGNNATTPKPFIFIVTDGADNNQTFDGSNWTGSQPQRPTNFGYCQYAQSLGVTVSILYIPYQPILAPNPNFAGNEDGKVNAVVPSIPADLQSCASPGFFFTANSDADINNAMQAMFAQALRAARITN